MQLTKENIEFYIQRRKQYCQDFLKLTNQFKPKLALLQKRLIATKQGIDGPIKSVSHQHKIKKVNKVLASLSKSEEVQNKIDKEMVRRQCQYKLDEVPNCNFNYSQTCNKIQQAMIPLIQNLQVQIKDKEDQIQGDSDCSDLYIKRDEFHQMKHKSKRLQQIIEKLQVMEVQQEEKVYRESIRKLEKFDKEFDYDETLPYQALISKRRLEAKVLMDEEKRQRRLVESERVRENVEEQKQKYHLLDNKIKIHYRKIGISKGKLESVSDFQQNTNDHKSIPQLNGDSLKSAIKQQLKSILNADKRFSLTLFSTQLNSSNIPYYINL
ncbi:unnamed protein product (macronuclear) [Paramecium tetraurelia]|uniref:Chromosome undetermined scaffold_1, whole genome shotgun sequence n=1 Tax=Paramecium tetraurelia TaxID=5888 RepID=Q6BG45_PARTE|nr:hypothetical protein [Paramecium tetraurelia strain d4-2]XP_001423308.1 uncharacterized protein GSPATT00000345001 [Paramecium tetraurelia]CAH03375.1 hypothetical protein PTMB.178c [Paramecium tetraurelia]CAK55910.1 unnamed protein product [Paramecium tetraurelia]|eukprot:XP_001423308.1 hypothetical protein (macronuclear) [Paramecium tetraurelia strain d4-2]